MIYIIDLSFILFFETYNNDKSVILSVIKRVVDVAQQTPMTTYVQRFLRESDVIKQTRIKTEINLYKIGRGVPNAAFHQSDHLGLFPNGKITLEHEHEYKLKSSCYSAPANNTFHSTGTKQKVFFLQNTLQRLRRRLYEWYTSQI